MTQCANPDCENEVLSTRTNALWCGRRCGTRVRNLRYQAKKYGIRGPKTRAALAVPPPEFSPPPPIEDKTLDFEERLDRVFSRLTVLPRPDPLCMVPPPLPEEDLGFGPQHQVALFSDLHRGLIVDSQETGGLGGYNLDICRDRLAKWRDKVPRFRQTYRFEVTKLWLLDLGDDFAGHGKMYPAQAYFLQEHLTEQVVGFVVDMEDVLRCFAAAYQRVHVVKVKGNHGRTGDKRGDRPERDNVETLAWRWIADRVRDLDNVTIEIAEGFFALVDILDHVFYLTHGEDILPASPYAQRGGLNTKLRMNSVLGRVINYLCLAHHHYKMTIEREIGGKLIVNGCFPGPDLLSVKTYHEANLPSQKVFAVHPKWGITHETEIYLASPEEVRQVPVYGGTP